MNYQYLQIEQTGPLATMTIKREEALNALNSAVITELAHAVSALELSDDIRVVALTGAGRSFIAGADIAEMRDLSPRQAQAFAHLGAAVADSIEASAKPYIAQVNGFALGGGCEMALACDFIYASNAAKFGQPEVKLGVIPGFGGTQRLARRVGVAKAKELIFSGEIINAEEALRIGLVDAMVEPGALKDKVSAVAKAIAANGPLAVAEAKRAIQRGQSMPLADACQLELHGFASLFGTDDQREGMAAFLDKRTAAFKGS